MNKRAALSTVLCAFVLAIASTTIFVQRTVAAYSGVCGPLDGVPAILQRVGFIPDTTGCKFDSETKECAPKTCAIDGKPGKCVLTVVNKKKVCVCTPRRISR